MLTEERMMTFPDDRVVVGVDGSEPSKQALRWGLFFAQTTGTAIDAVMAWTIPTFAGAGVWPADWNPELDAAHALHGAVTEVLGEHPPVAVRETVVEGGAARVLLGASEGARILVVGSRGHGGFAGLLLGAVSAACAEHASGAVLIVHGGTPPPPPVATHV
jgi:nucleotide-binding universal stress UspA family protein